MIAYLHLLDYKSYILLGIIVLFVFLLYLFRKKTFVKEMVCNAILESEKSFNSDEGQKKLEFAVENVKNKLPFILKIFFTKRILVSMIESTLNKLCRVFEIKTIVDIKGNEDVISLKSNLNCVEVTYDKNKLPQLDDKELELYANLRTETDWKRKVNTSVEVGIKKRF